MNLEEAIRKTLIEDIGVNGVVQSRIYPDIALEDTQFPCVVYSRPDSIPDESSYTLAGPGLFRVSIVLSALGRTSAEAHAVADAIYGALGPYQGQRDLQTVAIEGLHFSNLQDIGRDPDSGIYRFDRTMEILQN